MRLVELATTVTACVALAGCAVPAPYHVERVVSAGGGLDCRVYMVPAREPPRDALLDLGGTGTRSAARIPPELAAAFDVRPVRYVTFDKPGVRGRFGELGSTTIDDAAFARHTQGSLIACAEQALASLGAGVRWHIHGHSEGALIALFVYDDLLANDPARASQIASLVLTGLPLEPFGEIVRRQTREAPAVARAIATCDWTVLRTLGVSCAYLADAAARPSGRAMFERLAARSASAHLVVFQGDADDNTPAQFVRELADWNAATGHLDLEVSYYRGAHAGSPEARRQLADLIVHAIERASLDHR
jgi:hypothetical protein